ncbi:MAG: hypothetical protein SCG73_02095 [Nitrospiraceae bacterium]|jgi:hypothetical protein|nr:hypothetical protein [Nitrospira sp.]MDW7648394.1 hypothetical protein [Nitrospiraceae bacterium]PHX90916.1 MAG: hypothetical protein CK534_02575 [Nitrospirota bacterium]MBP0122075.1 hypothetical protein [Nitrospira sp.]MBP0123882.1 hypothetical protein [Nitrospira sp.]
MDEQDFSSTAPSGSQAKKPLDTVVKLAISVLVGSFALIWGGMYLSRPDRSIPPYSIGSQEETSVAIHVPPWTSDGEIETLIERFRKVGHETRNFGPMKVRPTTPDDPTERYRLLTIYIFSLDAWAEPAMLHQYLAAEDRDVRDGVRKALRGLYRLTESEEEGRIGPLLDGPETAATQIYARQLFKGPLSLPSVRAVEPTIAP